MDNINAQLNVIYIYIFFFNVNLFWIVMVLVQNFRVSLKILLLYQEFLDIYCKGQREDNVHNYETPKDSCSYCFLIRVCKQI